MCVSQENIVKKHAQFLARKQGPLGTVYHGGRIFHDITKYKGDGQ